MEMPREIRLQEKPPAGGILRFKQNDCQQFQNIPPVSSTRYSRIRQGKFDISKGREEVRMKGRKRVKMCAFTWWHTVAGDTGGVGVRLG